MTKAIEKFLEFNGKAIYFRAVDGQYWVAVKPICEALNVDYSAQWKRLKSDRILKAAYANQPMQVPNDQLRNMVSLPEKYIYGWLFSIQSNSDELTEYKRECYELLYNHFHGTIAGRKDLLAKKSKLAKRENELLSNLVDDNDFRELLDLKSQMKAVNTALNKNDKEILEEQQRLWQD